MMLALIKKDLRVFLTPTLGGIVLITCGYLIALTLYFFEPSSTRYLDDMFAPMAGIGSTIVVVLASAYGGSAFAAERREHSSDWLNMLPVTRKQIMVSKVIAAFGCLVMLWIYNLLPVIAVYVDGITLREARIALDQIFWMFLSVMGMCFVLFGLAWLCSTFLESAAISACIALMFIFMSILAMQGLREVLHVRSDPMIIATIVVVSMTSLACFAVGTRYYLNRVEP